jgi:hypothetical protein
VSGDPQLVSRAGIEARLTAHATQQNRAAASAASVTLHDELALDPVNFFVTEEVLPFGRGYFDAR